MSEHDDYSKWLSDWTPVEGELAERDRLYKEQVHLERKTRSQQARAEAFTGTWKLICICGHPVINHSPLGGENRYARCQSKTIHRCNCEMHARAVLKIRAGGGTRFTRRARGYERPHALTGAIKNLHENGQEFIWLVTECDRCHGPFQGEPIAHTLDDGDQIQRPGQLRSDGGKLSKDTGKHILICAICDYEDMMRLGYKGSDLQRYR